MTSPTNSVQSTTDRREHTGHEPEGHGCCGSSAKKEMGGGYCGGGGACGSGHAHEHDDEHEHEHAAAGGGCCGGGGGGGGCCGGGGQTAQGEQIYVFSKRQARELDRLAIEEYAVPSILLMENAARGVASVILEALASIPSPSAVILCGPGNNGGDGFAVARHLHNRGVRTSVVVVSDPAKLTGDARTNFAIVEKMGLPLVRADIEGAGGAGAVTRELQGVGAPHAHPPHIIIDALLGTGTDRPVSGLMAEVVLAANKAKESGTSIIAVDVPSGLDCDTGRPIGFDEGTAGPTIQADLTIALAGVKAGYMSPMARPYVGELVVVDIGAPVELVRRLGHPLG